MGDPEGLCQPWCSWLCDSCLCSALLLSTVSVLGWSLHHSTAQLHPAGGWEWTILLCPEHPPGEFHCMFPSRWPELLIELGKFPFPVTFFPHLTPNQSCGWFKKLCGPKGTELTPWCESWCFWLVALVSFQAVSIRGTSPDTDTGLPSLQ